MNFVGPNDPKAKVKRLRKAISKPLLQNVIPAHGQTLPMQWNHSAVTLPMPPPAQPNVQPYYPPRQHTQLQRPVYQPHAWASTTSLPAYPSLTLEGSESSVHNAHDQTRDAVGDRFSEIISLIDEELYTGSDQDVVIAVPDTPPPTYTSTRSVTFPPDQTIESERSLSPHLKPNRLRHQASNRSINVLGKLSQYSNSRLPASLPPFRAYIPTYPLLCLAALCSANAYQYRQNAVRDEQLVSADSRIGTKAMVIKSVTCADEKTIVFAIRGTSVLSLRDWNVNLNYDPESPAGFLDDEGNYCHAGFLRVAKAMVKPIAARLRRILEENPNRLNYSLLITGHSAGGAVASLLYTHMMSEVVTSELTILADCFKRVHCVTFGAPPVSLLPLRKPPGKEHRLQKCLFHSFMNEGDPVVRAEKSYVMSLVDLLTTTPSSASSLMPTVAANLPLKPSGLCTASTNMLKITNLGLFTGPKKHKPRNQSLPLPPRPNGPTTSKATWAVPPGTLSNAGRLVVLRGPEPPPKASITQVDLTREFQEVRAFVVTDDEIRKVIFGDPLMHAMEVYRRRIEALAMKAVTGRDKFY